MSLRYFAHRSAIFLIQETFMLATSLQQHLLRALLALASVGF